MLWIEKFGHCGYTWYQRSNGWYESVWRIGEKKLHEYQPPDHSWQLEWEVASKTGNRYTRSTWSALQWWNSMFHWKIMSYDSDIRELSSQRLRRWTPLVYWMKHSSSPRVDKLERTIMQYSITTYVVTVFVFDFSEFSIREVMISIRNDPESASVQPNLRCTSTSKPLHSGWIIGWMNVHDYQW